MNNDYTLISNLDNIKRMQSVHTSGSQQQDYPNKYDLIQKYLRETDNDNDSEDDDETDEECENDCNGTYFHVYGIPAIILLIIILFYVYKIRKELTGMYEEL